jgi:hypothetical protein
MSGGIFQLICNDGAQDRYLMGDGWFGVFKPGQIVTFDEYLDYIQEKLLAKIYFESEVERWKREYVQTCLLLRKKFQMETGVYFKQFDALVFKQVPFRPRPVERNDVMEIIYDKAVHLAHAQTRVLLRKKFEMETGSKWRQFDQHVFKYLDYDYHPRVIPGLGTRPWSIRFCPKMVKYDHVKDEVDALFVRNAHLIRKKDIIKCLEKEPIVDSSQFDDFADLVLRYYKSKIHVSQTFTRRTHYESIFHRDTNFAIESTSSYSLVGTISKEKKLAETRLINSEAKKNYKKKQRIENRPTQLKRAAAKLPKSVMQKKIYVRPTARRVQYNKKMKK